MPLNGAEVSGLVPDHFLDELPVALARLAASGKLTYANRAARQLLGDRARPGVNLAELIEGLGRPITERLADTTKGRALGRSEIARGTADGQEIFLQVAFTRTVLDGAPVAPRGLLRRHRAEDPRSPVRPVPEDAGRRPARRRRRPRLQQPADRHQRPLRPAADAPRGRRRRARRPHADPPERQPRRRARPPAARLLAQADPAPHRHQPPGHALRAHPPAEPPADRQGHAADRARPRPRPGPRRRAPDRAGDHEPRRQRPRRHAARRRGPHHHPQRPPGARPATATAPRSSRATTW